jgi:hypothetical protein
MVRLVRLMPVKENNCGQEDASEGNQLKPLVAGLHFEAPGAQAHVCGAAAAFLAGTGGVIEAWDEQQGFRQLHWLAHGRLWQGGMDLGMGEGAKK